MKGTILTVGSITQAVKARRLLARNGIRAKLVKYTTNKSGCNYAVEINTRALYDAAAILRGADIPYTVLGDV